MFRHKIQHILSAIFVLCLLNGLTACSNTTETLKVSMAAEGFRWDPSSIQAKVNQPIEITLHNNGALDHEFLIEELDINVRVRPNGVEIVSFSIDHTGSIIYICNVPGHEEAGMVGEIIITD